MLFYDITNPMQQSPSWEANSFSQSQQILHIVWNPTSQYRATKFPPRAPYPEPN